MAAIDRRAVLGRHVEGVEDVLHADRHAAQRRVFAVGVLPGKKRPRLHLGLASGDPFQAARDERLRAELAALDPVGGLFRSQTAGLDHRLSIIAAIPCNAETSWSSARDPSAALRPSPAPGSAMP
jgi:hypothetical protein